MNENTSRVVVSVDDFGISERANTHILTLVAAKKIDRVSVMMNGILKLEDVTILVGSGIKLDIHLDRKHIIHENRKLADGFLGRLVEFIWSYFFGSNRPSRVHQVWHGQLQKFQEIFGKNPDGLNAHEHVHYFPPYFRALLGLAHEYHIPFIRLGYKNTKNYTWIAFIINILGTFNRGALKKTAIQTTDRVVSFDWIFQKNVSWDEFQSGLEAGTVTEVIFHPERQEEFEFMKNSF